LAKRWLLDGLLDKRWHSKVNNWRLVVKTLYEQPLAANHWPTVGEP